MAPWSGLQLTWAPAPCWHCLRRTALAGVSAAIWQRLHRDPDFAVTTFQMHIWVAWQAGLTLSCSSGRRNPVKYYWKTPKRSFKSTHISSASWPRNFRADLLTRHCYEPAHRLLEGAHRRFFMPTQRRGSSVRAGFSSPAAFQGPCSRAHGASSPRSTPRGTSHTLTPSQLPPVLAPVTLMAAQF